MTGWNKNGEWSCPWCKVQIGKNLLGEKPFGLVREHITECKLKRAERWTALSGWDIAKEVSCGYVGDANPIDHDGTFYDLRDWEEYGYASCVELIRMPDTDGELWVCCGTINKADDMKQCFATIGFDIEETNGTKYAVDYEGGTYEITSEMEIEACLATWGFEQADDYAGEIVQKFPDETDEQEVWSSIQGWIEELGDNG